MERLGGAERRRVSATDESERKNAGRTLEDVHTTHGRGGGVPDDKIGTLSETNLSPNRGAGASAHIGRVHSVCDVEDAAEVDGGIWARARSADSDRRVCAIEMLRGDIADEYGKRDIITLRNETGQTSGDIVKPIRAEDTRAIRRSEMARKDKIRNGV